MQIGDRAVATRQDPAPDHRTDLANPYIEPVNFGAGLVCHHGLSLAKGLQNQNHLL